MPRFEVLAGRHIERGAGPKGEDKTYKRGDVFESELELDKVFVNKFRRVAEDKVMTAVTEALPKAAEDLEKMDVPDPGEPAKIHEHDVTAEFPTAAKADLKVFKVGKKYRVVDADTQDTQLHTGFFTKKEAAEFIATQSGGD